MDYAENLNSRTLARTVGWSLLTTIVIGALSAVFVVGGIDINLSADVAKTAQNMLDAEMRLRAKEYITLLLFGIGAFITAGLFLLLRKHGQVIATWGLFVGLAAAITTVLSAMLAANAAEIASDPAYRIVTDEGQRLMLASLQATTDYTSFHIGLILSSASNAAFFYLFLKSKLIPKFIAGWGVFASLFVVSMLVARDFIPVLGHGNVTAAFMLSNLIALVLTGGYLAFWGIKNTPVKV